jgi:hypothetical protein
MTAGRSSRIAKTIIYGLVSPFLVNVRQSVAQSEPATIPIAVAQAMTFAPAMFGRPQFFDGRAPTDWPAALVPPDAKILGGGVMANLPLYRMRVTVFAFPAQSDPRARLRDVVARAGYVQPAARPPSRGGGFAQTAEPSPPGRYCKGSTLATFDVVDSVHTPKVFALFLLEGDGGAQNCNPSHMDMLAQHSFPVTVPSLTPPAGVMSFGTGTGWSGNSGHMSTTLRTTMPTDSLLAHYSMQLVSAGWRADGRPANGDGAAVQRFSFQQGQEAWTGALIIMAAGDQRTLFLQLARNE